MTLNVKSFVCICKNCDEYTDNPQALGWYHISRERESGFICAAHGDALFAVPNVTPTGTQVLDLQAIHDARRQPMQVGPEGRVTDTRRRAAETQRMGGTGGTVSNTLKHVAPTSSPIRVAGLAFSRFDLNRVTFALTCIAIVLAVIALLS